MRKPFVYAIGMTLLLLLASCKRDGTGWDTGLVAPLATTNMTLGNLVKDSILRTNSDSSLSLVYSNTVYELNLADQFIHIPDTSIGQKYTIDSLQLPNIRVRQNISLGQLALNLNASGQGLLGNFIIGHNGQLTSLPAVSGLTVSPFYFNGAGYYKTARITNADLLISVVNHLPTPLQNVSFDLRDSTSNQLLLSDYIANISPQDSVTRSYHLSNVNIGSSLKLTITNFSIPGTGSGTVYLDTTQYLSIWAFITNIRVDSAVAVFPAQDIISINQDLTQNIAPRKFTYIDCSQGQLDVQITSSVPQPLHLKYQMLGAYDRSGNGLIASSDLPPALNGNLTTVTKSYDLSGYSINLTGRSGTEFNTYTQIIQARIDSTGNEVTLSNKDSVHIQYFLRNIKPRYIKGYAGRDTISYAGNSPFSIADLFAGNSSNALKFDRASLSVSVENGIGVDGQVLINSLTGINSNGTSVTLVDHSATPVIGRQLYVNKATDFPLTPRTTTFNLNSATSNITDFISNLPNQIAYDVKIQTNPYGNRGTYDDFAYIDSRMKVNLDINLPLSLIANNLTLRDSFNFSLGYSQKDVANIKDGVLHVILYNKFPLQANITLVAYDSAWNKLDTLLNNAQVDAAPINTSCRATDAKKSMINVNASAEVIDKLRFSKHAIMTVVFNTKSSNATCNGQYLKIYSDYNINATITGDFNYKVKF